VGSTDFLAPCIKKKNPRPSPPQGDPENNLTGRGWKESSRSRNPAQRQTSRPDSKRPVNEGGVGSSKKIPNNWVTGKREKHSSQIRYKNKPGKRGAEVEIKGGRRNQKND